MSLINLHTNLKKKCFKMVENFKFIFSGCMFDFQYLNLKKHGHCCWHCYFSFSDSIPLKASPLVSIEEVIFPKGDVHYDQILNIELKIACRAPCDVSCDQICLSFVETKSSPEHFVKTLVSRQTSDSSLSEHVANTKPMAKVSSNVIPIHENVEGNPGSPVLCGVFCFQAKEILRRTDSTGSKGKVKQVVVKKEDYSWSIDAQDVVLKPGENSIVLAKKVHVYFVWCKRG